MSLGPRQLGRGGEDVAQREPLATRRCSVCPWIQENMRDPTAAANVGHNARRKAGSWSKGALPRRLRDPDYSCPAHNVAKGCEGIESFV